jgi:hypothetical protein
LSSGLINATVGDNWEEHFEHVGQSHYTRFHLSSAQGIHVYSYVFAIPRKKSVFGSVIAGDFQIIFYVKIYGNDIFLFFKNYF